MGILAGHEYKVEVQLPSGRWVTVAGTRIYREWRTACDKYVELSIARPNDKFRIVWRNVTTWSECYT